ncbi:MAG TPA: methyltransferase domain-containing protein [Bryobacteraceae bacterium]|nr:methyltransferase domain-containing protein [Bryobacteraceae bacterium]
MHRLFLLGALTGLCFAQDTPPQTAGGEKLAPYFPTPPLIVEKMLRLASVRPGDKVFDLGSGDGRIVIAAAKQFKAEATGVEFDKALYEQSSETIRKLRLQKKARIIYGDLFQQDYSSADVITVYLLPASNRKILPMLESQLKKGTRIVAHDFDFAGWEPVKTEVVDNDGEGRSHTLFLYVR